ncbi:MAG TPA: hypothetical protein VKU44_00445 [Terriglobia bacterium]|nr:hypothetical protein [Terriglobia bacterium]
MPSPCPKCGGVKIEPADAGLLYWLAEVLGYRLRICGRCRGYRLFRIREPRRSRSSHRHEADTIRSSDLPPADSAAAVALAGASPDPPAQAHAEGITGRLRLCPWCGSQDLRRSHRTWWERRRGKPPMYRCQECRHRFPRADDD